MIDVPIPQDHLRDMLIFSFRYALGRRSTAPSTMDSHVRRYEQHIPVWMKKQMIGDIEYAVKNGLAGDDCDVEEWERLAGWLKERCE